MQKILIRKPGGYDRLELVTAEPKVPEGDEVLVETAGIGVNFADVVVRLGLYPSAKEYVGWPITPGFEFSGRVSAVGPRVTGVRVGDPVLGVSRFGAYSTHVVVPEDYLFPVPEGIPLDAAGAIPVAHLTAYYALHVLGAVRAGSRVLVHSAAGAVGSALVQLARLAGARVVGVVGSARKVAAVRALGANEVIDKGSEKLWAKVKEYCPEGYDVVLDANGYETLRGSYRALRPTGRLVVYGAHSMLSRGSARPNWLKLAVTFLMTPRFSPLDLTNDNKSVLAFNLSYLFEEREMLRRVLPEILAPLGTGALRLPELTRMPLSQAPEAHRLLQSGNTIGKILLIP